MPIKAELPAWAKDLIDAYESDAASQFVIHGNVSDRQVLPALNDSEELRLGSLEDFLLEVLLPRFDVVLAYDLGNGIRVLKGEKLFAEWPFLKNNPQLPKSPRQALETLSHYFRYCGNLALLGGKKLQVGCILREASLITPAGVGTSSLDISAMALLIRDWTLDTLLCHHALATFLVTENINDLHPLLANNARMVSLKVPLPQSDTLEQAFAGWAKEFPAALSAFKEDLAIPARQLVGATMASFESLLKTREHRKEPLQSGDLVKLKKHLVERDCGGLIEFIESKRTLADLYGQEAIKARIRQDIALWQQNDLDTLPMGYLLCGPVGTGKTFLVECLAGEAGVPVVKLKNFRDKWVGSTEGNLEKIFRLLHGLGRCFVFIDEADQALGKRDSGAGSDSNLSGRIYSMIAEEMSNPANRGRILWVLASSRPDLIEVDLKRPGRIDLKIPIFPTLEAVESFRLIEALAKRRGLVFQEGTYDRVRERLPLWLTPGAAEALVIKLYRLTKTEKISPEVALENILKDYRNPIAAETMRFQVNLAIAEASDVEFIPTALR